MRIAGHAGGSGPAPWEDGGRCRPGAWSQPHLSRGATTTVSCGAHAATVIIPNSSRPSSVVVANGLVMDVSFRPRDPVPTDGGQPRSFALPACFSAREICNDL